ncbi:hypothetical protein COCMIDRAFT_1741 [Bipolaris oryzae ATCC 44560]|uniref:Aminoglycoside phosphotransferase domain-containing protein n=1 Tax=Bipolaris oryzae ATCC 44560 TaxID=930090 RepID=W6ZHL9_COCMI|nr:uncharacterized protein COCMIDRAFT_1741 [Bipolaris oryzae ATCC 44560]EUC49490.1 hypothetical protein COCMIDRAFT_1741 [Bipolaris oryzae ATCC 44560]
MASQGFWGRFNLRNEDGKSCMRAIQNAYIGYRVKELEQQGYCSCTLLVAPLSGTEHSTIVDKDLAEEFEGRSTRSELIVQLRPAPHALDLDIVHVAAKIYPSLAPTVALLDVELPEGLKAYEMDRIPGTSLSRLMPHARTLTTKEQARLETLVLSFAKFIAQGWQGASKAQTLPTLRATRADSPMEDTPDILSQCRGKVGSSIIYRLEKLAAELPDTYLRRRAGKTLSAIQNMTDYPVILNHGDLIPSNILVDGDRWEMTGLVDWAEAEFLPFGTCLYGLEHLLGYYERDSSSKKSAWVYFEGAARLREAFWEYLFAAAPGLKAREDEVRTMRDMGVLLWHGIAWDDGAINRVVSELRDQEELVKLRAFLGTD